MLSTAATNCWSGCAATILSAFRRNCGSGFAQRMRARSRLLWLLRYRYIQLNLGIVSPGSFPRR